MMGFCTTQASLINKYKQTEIRSTRSGHKLLKVSV